MIRATAVRAVLPALRPAALRITPARSYTDGPAGGSKEFGQKEKSEEERYIRAHEAEMKKLREENKKHKAKIAELESAAGKKK